MKSLEGVCVCVCEASATVFGVTIHVFQLGVTQKVSVFPSVTHKVLVFRISVTQKVLVFRRRIWRRIRRSKQ